MGGTNIIDELVISRDEWRFRAERAEAERDAARAEAGRLREALQQVEWVSDEFGEYCPWCGREYSEYGLEKEHKPDCPRQAALTPAPGETDETE